jgi:hypothetical protein
MSFIKHAYQEIKAIDPSITTDQFSTNWLNKCSSYYRSYKASDRDMTLHTIMCLLINLSNKADALRRNNNHKLLHAKAEQYLALGQLAQEQLTDKLPSRR